MNKNKKQVTMEVYMDHILSVTGENLPFGLLKALVHCTDFSLFSFIKSDSVYKVVVIWEQDDDVWYMSELISYIKIVI